MSRVASRLGRRPKRPRDEVNVNQSWSKNTDDDNNNNNNNDKSMNEILKE